LLSRLRLRKHVCKATKSYVKSYVLHPLAFGNVKLQASPQSSHCDSAADWRSNNPSTSIENCALRSAGSAASRSRQVSTMAFPFRLLGIAWCRVKVTSCILSRRSRKVGPLRSSLQAQTPSELHQVLSSFRNIRRRSSLASRSSLHRKHAQVSRRTDETERNVSASCMS
jgi:hypothetical protein